MADEAEQRASMVHVLREEPGSAGFIAEWEYATGGEPARSHKEEFSSHADAMESALG